MGSSVRAAGERGGPFLFLRSKNDDLCQNLVLTNGGSGNVSVMAESYQEKTTCFTQNKKKDVAHVAPLQDVSKRH